MDQNGFECKNCKNPHDGGYGSGVFCSCKCARGYSTKEKRQEINKKVSLINSQKFDHARIEKKKSTCPQCKESFEWKYGDKVFCDRKCFNLFIKKHGVAIVNETSKQKEQRLKLARLNGAKSSKIQSEIRRSKNEKFFADLCKNHFGEEVLTNQSMFNGWDADVIIPSKKIAVLWNGKWHYEKITKKHSVEQVQNRDRIKNEEIRRCGFKPYIIEDRGAYNEEFVKNQFFIFLQNI